MKPKTQGGVVDKYLNVYGTENLKIAGASTDYVIKYRSFDLSIECRLKHL